LEIAHIANKIIIMRKILLNIFACFLLLACKENRETNERIQELETKIAQQEELLNNGEHDSYKIRETNENIEQQKITPIKNTKENVIAELGKLQTLENIKIDTEMENMIFIGDVNNDGFEDAVITYFVKDSEMGLEFGKASGNNLWRIALFINDLNNLNLSDNIPFSNLVPVNAFGFDEYKIKSLGDSKLKINYMRDKSYDVGYDAAMGQFELIPIEISIKSGKFIIPK